MIGSYILFIWQSTVLVTKFLVYFIIMDCRIKIHWYSYRFYKLSLMGQETFVTQSGFTLLEYFVIVIVLVQQRKHRAQMQWR